MSSPAQEAQFIAIRDRIDAALLVTATSKIQRFHNPKLQEKLYAHYGPYIADYNVDVQNDNEDVANSDMFDQVYEYSTVSDWPQRKLALLADDISSVIACYLLEQTTGKVSEEALAELNIILEE